MDDLNTNLHSFYVVYLRIECSPDVLRGEVPVLDGNKKSSGNNSHREEETPGLKVV